VFEKKREESYRVMEAAKYEAVPKDRREFIQKPIWQETHAGIQTSLRKPEAVSEQTEVQSLAPAATPESKEDDFFVEAAPLEPRDETSSEPVICPETAEVKAVQQMNLFEEKLLSVQNRSRYRIIGQVFDTYWLIQFEDKLFIIDQHAAHEKVKYERLMKQFHEKSVVSQRLMPPIIVSLTGQEESILHTYEDAFTQLGFEIEAFGGNEYALRSVPVDLYGCSERELFLAVLDELSQEHSGHFRIFLPADYILKKYTGREKTGYFMRLGDREWKQDRKVSFLQYDSILNTHSMKILKMFGINGTFGKITYREYQKTEYLHDDSEAKEILQEKISDFLESLGEKGVQIISKDVKIETKCDGWVAHGELVVQEKVGTQVDTTQKED
jgi:hypothetical protein